MQEVVVLYPAPGMGHIVAMVELGKLLLRHSHDHQFSITILLTTGYWDTNGVLSYIHKISLTHPSITFHRFPLVTVDPPSLTRSPAAALFQFIRLHAANARRSLEQISKNSTVRAFIIDLFCTSALSIGKDLQIPTYYFYTSGAGAFTAFLHFPALDEQFQNHSYKDLTTTVLRFPAAVPPLKATQMPEPLLDRNDPAYHDFLWCCASIPLSNGVIINTFEELEFGPVKALLEGKCLTDKLTAIPPVYCIGPLIAESEAKPHDCLKWLDAQPKRSVLFLCFGTRGSFTVLQLHEIAQGLERSGVRFLWVVKAPPFDEKRKQSEADDTNFELEEILPAGFINRVNDRAMVVKSWAPQVQVLNHESVGGFVTHCGWNSVLEAVVAGVPMAAWPLYAEQHLNRNLLVEEMKMAVGFDQRNEDGFVSGEEVEKRVRELMTGTELDKKSKIMRDLAMAALGKSGSSTIALAKFVQSWSQSCRA